jgi:YhgE/Pip-like protein
MSLFKHRLFRIGILAVFIVITIFGLAMMGTAAGAKPKSLPVALVILDKGTVLPGGGSLAFGETIGTKLMENDKIPVKWQKAGSLQEAQDDMDNQSVYGALILPEDLSAGIASLQTPAPHPATVRILVNDGMNAQAASAVRQILHQLADTAGKEISAQLFQQIGQKTKQLPLETAQALTAPILVQEESVHPYGANNAGGGAPNLLSQIAWIGSLVCSVTLFLASSQTAAAARRRWPVLIAQMGAGLLTAGLASLFLVWMASSWYGMELNAILDTWLFLWLAASVFFLLQSSLLNWLGFPAIAILVLLLFFSIPVINMAPEFLLQATRDWLYSWTPFRFVSSGLRDVMYYGSARELNLAVLWSLFGAFAAVMAASAFRPAASRKPAAADAPAKAPIPEG